MMDNCVLCKAPEILIPGLSDEKIKVIRDIRPVDKSHYLIVPRIHVEEWRHIPAFLGEVIMRVRNYENYYLRINQGSYRQLAHCHIHLISSDQWDIISKSVS